VRTEGTSVNKCVVTTEPVVLETIILGNNLIFPSDYEGKSVNC